MDTTPNPTVFISYAHGSETHSLQVLKLNDALRGFGVDCKIDIISDIERPLGWWMEEEITQANFVLVIFNKLYNTKLLHESKGKGVFYELNIILQGLFDKKLNNKNVLSVIFNPNDEQFIPSILRSYPFYTVNINQKKLEDDDGFIDLYRKIKNFRKYGEKAIGRDLPLPIDVNIKKIAIVFPKSLNEDENVTWLADCDALLGKIKEFQTNDFTVAVRSFSKKTESHDILRQLQPVVLHYMEKKERQLFPFTDPQRLNGLFKSLGNKVQCLIIQNYPPHIQEEQIINILQFIEYAIGIPGTLDQEKTLHFLSKFYESFFEGNAANLAFLRGAFPLVENQEKEENSPILMTQKENKMVQYKGLEQISRLKEELAAVESRTNLVKKELSPYEEVFLKDNEFAPLIGWLSNHQEQLLDVIGKEIIEKRKPGREARFLPELKRLFELVQGCLLTKNPKFIVDEDLEKMRISNSVAFYEIALMDLIEKIPNEIIDNKSIKFFKSISEDLFDRLRHIKSISTD